MKTNQTSLQQIDKSRFATSNLKLLAILVASCVTAITAQAKPLLTMSIESDPCKAAPAPHVNYSGCNLAGRNFSNADLRGANFSSANLQDARFSNARAQGASFANAKNLRFSQLAEVFYGDLSNTNLSGLKLGGTYFSKLKLHNADLNGTDLTDFRMSGAVDLGEDIKGTGLTLTNIKLNKADGWAIIALLKAAKNHDLSGADLRGLDLSAKDLQNVNFTGAKLTNVNWSNATVVGAKFYRTEIIPADLAKVRNQNFNRADLRGINFSYVEMPHADFSEANLQGAKFYNGNVHGANWKNALVHGVELSAWDNKNKIKIDLQKFFNEIYKKDAANLVLTGGVSFGELDLRGVNLTHANLAFMKGNIKTDKNTSFRFADLNGVSLPHATLPFFEAELAGASTKDATIDNKRCTRDIRCW